MKKSTIPLVCILLLVLGLVLLKDRIISLMAEQVVKRAVGKGQKKPEDGLHAYLIGTGSPLPDINRAGPCIAVVAGDKIYVVDAGEAAARNIMLCGITIGRVDALFLTHFHSDHIAGLGEMMLQRWGAGSNNKPLPVYGPTGVEQVVEGFNMAYKLDDGYRVAHHDAKTFPPSGAGGVAITFPLGNEPDASTVIVDSGGVKITAFKVDHFPAAPAVGYKFEYKGRSLVISGDTKYSESLAKQAIGADLLLHEALNRKFVALIGKYSYLSQSPSISEIMEAIPTYHSTPEDAAKIAQKAHVRKLVLYHIIPPIPSSIFDGVFLGDAHKYYDGPITVGVDGMLITLPANSKEIKTKYLFSR